MTVTKLPNGAINIMTIVNDSLVQRSYYGYTVKEARTKFRELVKKAKNGN